jgi:septal ring factor EnvC (AmiA/AmiB activator)
MAAIALTDEQIAARLAACEAELASVCEQIEAARARGSRTTALRLRRKRLRQDVARFANLVEFRAQRREKWAARRLDRGDEGWPENVRAPLPYNYKIAPSDRRSASGLRVPEPVDGRCPRPGCGRALLPGHDGLYCLYDGYHEYSTPRPPVLERR